MTMGKQHVLQTTEVRIRKRTNRIPRNGHKPQLGVDGPHETYRNQELANSNDNKTSPIIPWIWKLLPEIYQEVHTLGKTLKQLVKERRHL